VSSKMREVASAVPATGGRITVRLMSYVWLREPLDGRMRSRLRPPTR